MTGDAPSTMRALPPDALRAAIRDGRFVAHTAGCAPGHVQANLVVLPAEHAAGFERFCRANPKPCPLLAVGEPGSVRLPDLGPTIDLRTDLPRYRVWRDGKLVDEPTSVAALWQDDLVAFAIGCSFTFESALRAAGLPLRYVEMGRNVPMYRTAMETAPAGRFGGAMVVSMRPFPAADAARAAEITARFPDVHGAPIHIGDPGAIGIADLSRPDFGDPTPVEDGEVPVFWACGVTPQLALMRARLPFAITHAPGAMLVTDRLDREYERTMPDTTGNRDVA